MDWLIRGCKQNGDVSLLGLDGLLLCPFQIKLPDSVVPSPEESKRFVLLVIRMSRLCVEDGILHNVYINKL